MNGQVGLSLLPELMCETMSRYVVSTEEVHYGPAAKWSLIRFAYHFPNGWGASVIWHSDFLPGEAPYEVGVLVLGESGANLVEEEMSPLGRSVFESVDAGEVGEVLLRIKRLQLRTPREKDN